MNLSAIIGGRIKSIQRGSLTFGHNASGNITITEVNVNKATLILSVANGHAGDGIDRVNELVLSAYLSSGTNIAWSSNQTMISTTVSNGTAYWQVVELC